MLTVENICQVLFLTQRDSRQYNILQTNCNSKHHKWENITRDAAPRALSPDVVFFKKYMFLRWGSPWDAAHCWAMAYSELGHTNGRLACVCVCSSTRASGGPAVELCVHVHWSATHVSGAGRVGLSLMRPSSLSSPHTPSWATKASGQLF